MALPDLCLLPHEAGDLAPGEPWCAPAQHRVAFRRWFHKRWYLARPILNRWNLRQWILRDEKDEASPLLLIGTPRHYPSAQDAEFAECLKYPSNDPRMEIARKIYFDSAGKLMTESGAGHRHLLISPVGQTYWVDGEHGCKFPWKTLQHPSKFPAVWWANASDAQVEAEIRWLLNDDTSFCSFAWRWIDLSRRAKNELLFQVKRGTLGECEKLVRATVWSEPLQLNEDQNWEVLLSSGWSWLGKAKTFAMEEKIETSAAIRTRDKSKCVNFCRRQEALLALIYREFGLHFNQELAKRHLDHRCGTFEDINWAIPLPAPTQHERLESLLSLRDWLQGKVSPDELAALMGEP